MLQMNKLNLIIILSILSLSSCFTETEDSNPTSVGNYSIRIIDGCEYIQVENGLTLGNNYNYTLTHKGNCKNEIHKCPCDR